MPLATPMAYRVPQNAAHSSSNCATVSPPTKALVRVSSAQPASTSSRTSSDMGARSRKGKGLRRVRLDEPSLVVAIVLTGPSWRWVWQPDAGC